MKKRMIGWLLALVMTAALLPVQALAAGLEQSGELQRMVMYQDPVTGEIVTKDIEGDVRQEEPAVAQYAAEADTYNYNESVPRYGYNALAKMEKGATLTTLYNMMMEAAKRYDGAGTYMSWIDGLRGEPIYTDSLDGGITDEEAWLVLNTMRHDHPELFWVMSALSQTHENDNPACKSVNLYFCQYDTSMEETKRIFLDAVEPFLQGVPQDGTEYEKEKYYHDALAEHITYNGEEIDQGAYTVMVKGEGVCAGYAAAFQYLLQCSGVESFVVSGKHNDVPHAWNIVKLEDGWHYVDLTADDGGVCELLYTYFNRGTEFMSEVNYVINEAMNVPVETLYDYDPDGWNTREWVKDFDDNYHALMVGSSGRLEKHQYTDEWEIVSAGNCEENGLKQRLCTVCGHKQEAEIVAPGSHSNVEKSVNGDYEVTCYCRTCGLTWQYERFLYEQLSDGTLEVTGCRDQIEDLVIPRQIKGVSVTRIGTNRKVPFSQNTALKTVVIPDTVTHINANCFANCTSLEAVLIPSSVLVVGYGAFNNCESLTDNYYTGNLTLWMRIIKVNGNDALLNAAIHYIQSGDLNGSGSVADAADVQCLYTYLTSGVIDGALAQREGIFRAAADLNGDGSVDVYDLQRLYEVASGLAQAA